MYDLKWLSSCLESESYTCLAVEYGQITQREWCYSEVVGTGRGNRTRPVCVGWPGQCYLQGKLEAYLGTPQNECSSPPPTLATVPLFCIHQGWKPCRKFAGYFPIAQALLHHYDVTSSLYFRILCKMGPRQPLPTKWNIFTTLDMSDEGVRAALFQPKKGKEY